MSNLHPGRPERRITGARYGSEKLIVRCEKCGESNLVTAESEFGCTIWLPANCPECGRAWAGDVGWEIDVM